MQATLEQIDLTKDSENFEWNKLLNPQETIGSFFNFCRNIGNKNPNYWEMVYSRIGITWETNDDNDRINFIIRHKYYFSENKENIPDEKNADKEYMSKPKHKGILH